MTNLPPPPWYRQFWPWLLIGLPAAAVIASVTTAIIAVRHHDPLVRDDWYKQGMAINRSVEREQVARHMGLSASMTLDAQGMLSVQLATRAGEPQPTHIQLTLQHPTRDDADLTRVLLLENGHGSIGPLTLPAAHHWYVIIESLPGEQPAWRMDGEWMPAAGPGTIVIAAPAR